MSMNHYDQSEILTTLTTVTFLSSLPGLTI